MEVDPVIVATIIHLIGCFINKGFFLANQALAALDLVFFRLVTGIHNLHLIPYHSGSQDVMSPVGKQTDISILIALGMNNGFAALSQPGNQFFLVAGLDILQVELLGKNRAQNHHIRTQLLVCQFFLGKLYKILNT